MNRKVSCKSMTRAACVCIMSLIALASLGACQARNDQFKQTEADAKKMQSEAPLTNQPSELPRTAETEAPEDKQPEETPAANSVSMGGTNRTVQDRSELIAFTQRLLEGKDIFTHTVTLEHGAVFFNLEEDGLVAYNKAFKVEEIGNCHYECFAPLAVFPRELGEMAKKSLVGYYKRNIEPGYSGDEVNQMEGYYGEDYIIFTDGVFHGMQASAIFVTSDGWKTWKEVPVIEGFPTHVTGGCMLSEEVGFLCYFARHLPDYKFDELSVYKTVDAGLTWKPLDVKIPRDKGGLLCDPVKVFSPMFEGDHGIMIVQYSEYRREEDEVDRFIGWFESFDGGDTWEFHPDPVAEFLKQ